MRGIIVYYSYSGNTEKVACSLARYLGRNYAVKIIRLQALDESGVFLNQAARAFFRKKAEITPVEYDLSNYDLICLGTPVWAFGPAPAINAYLDRCSGLEGRTIVLFATYGSGAGVARCLNYMEEILTRKKGGNFKKFSIQQSKVNDREFLDSVINQGTGL